MQPFNMLAATVTTPGNLEKIRRRSLRYLQLKHPDVDQTIAHVLITYCFVITEDRERILLSWLSGQGSSRNRGQGPWSAHVLGFF